MRYFRPALLLKFTLAICVAILSFEARANDEYEKQFKKILELHQAGDPQFAKHVSIFIKRGAPMEHQAKLYGDLFSAIEKADPSVAGEVEASVKQSLGYYSTTDNYFSIDGVAKAYTGLLPFYEQKYPADGAKFRKAFEQNFDRFETFRMPFEFSEFMKADWLDPSDFVVYMLMRLNKEHKAALAKDAEAEVGRNSLYAVRVESHIKDVLQAIAEAPERPWKRAAEVSEQLAILRMQFEAEKAAADFLGSDAGTSLVEALAGGLTRRPEFRSHFDGSANEANLLREFGINFEELAQIADDKIAEDVREKILRKMLAVKLSDPELLQAIELLAEKKSQDPLAQRFLDRMREIQVKITMFKIGMVDTRDDRRASLDAGKRALRSNKSERSPILAATLDRVNAAQTRANACAMAVGGASTR